MTSHPQIWLIWAQAHDRVIGSNGTIPWRLPEDLRHFRRLTTGHPVIMGRGNWDSLPEKFCPLPDRRNIVLTRQSGWQAPGAEVAHSLAEALALVGDTSLVWVIGGGQVYAEALPIADRVVLTEIDLKVPGDTFAPSLAGWEVVERTPVEGWLTSERGMRYRFVDLCPKDQKGASQ